MLCDRCKQLFNKPVDLHLRWEWEWNKMPEQGNATESLRFQHCESINALEESAHNGCQLCTLVMGCLLPSQIELVRPPLVVTEELQGSKVYNILAEIIPHRKEKICCFYLFFYLVYPLLPTEPAQQASVQREIVYLDLLPIETYQDFLCTQDVDISTGSSQTLSCIEQWLEDCVQNHPSCSLVKNSNPWKPTRLLDLGPVRAKLPPRLIEHGEIPAGVTYATLSHCWGTADVFKLQICNLQDIKNHVSVNQLSPTFQNAIEITRRLNIRYLWIDSICIIQDSVEDWELEASLMEHVYSNSFFNIAAAHASDGRGGLFLERNPLLIKPCKVTARWSDDESVELYCIHLRGWMDSLEREPLYARAWVVQERLLSRRICHFTSTELFWECNMTFACERLPHGRCPGIRFARLNFPFTNSETQSPHTHSESWALIVMYYSRANLTRETDKLAALSGIASKMQSLLCDDYLAGMWRKNLEYQLLWTARPIEDAIVELSVTRPTTYVAPSWSWASLNGAQISIRTHTEEYDNITLLCRVLHAEVTPKQSTTKCEDGFLNLQCYLAPVAQIDWLKQRFTLASYNDKSVHDHSPTQFNATIDITITNPKDFQFWCIPVSSKHYEKGKSKHYVKGKSSEFSCLEGLLLRSHNSTPKSYSRCGTFQIFSTKGHTEDFWKSFLEHGRIAAMTESSIAGICNDVMAYKFGSNGNDYELKDGVQQFKVVIR